MISMISIVLLDLMLAVVVGIASGKYEWGLAAGLFGAFLIWLADWVKDEIKAAIRG